jgi:hypothetical protein
MMAATQQDAGAGQRNGAGGSASGGASLPGLLFRGGRTIRDLAFKTFYYGSVWQQNPASTVINRLAAARTQIDNAIDAAMVDPQLNGILSQYFGGQPVTGKALPSEVIANAPRTASPNIAFNETDIRGVIADLLATRLAGIDLASTVVNIVLPPGMSLEILGLDEQARPSGAAVMPGVPRDAANFDSGIAGYHGSAAMQTAGTSVDVLYSVVVWSDGSTGIPVPGWQGWENVVATLYHELQETRTNPDVDRAVRSGDSRFIGWNTDPVDGPDGPDCREIADLPLILNNAQRYAAFARVSVAGQPTPVPIQLMWSNQHGRMMPDAAV